MPSSKVGGGRRKVDNNHRPPDHQTRVYSRGGSSWEDERSQEPRGKKAKGNWNHAKKEKKPAIGEEEKAGGVLESSDLWRFEDRAVLGLHDHWWAHVDDLIMEGGKPVDVED